MTEHLPLVHVHPRTNLLPHQRKRSIKEYSPLARVQALTTPFTIYNAICCTAAYDFQ